MLGGRYYPIGVFTSVYPTIDRPLKLSHPVASDYVPSPVLNTENHQLTLPVC